MGYYTSTYIKSNAFDEVLKRTVEALKREGFGVLTKIDMKATMKKKLNVEFHNYVILGACNPSFALEALQHEDKIGTMLPCNVIVQEKVRGSIEISAVNPIFSMQAVQNDQLIAIAETVQNKLNKVIQDL